MKEWGLAPSKSRESGNCRRVARCLSPFFHILGLRISQRKIEHCVAKQSARVSHGPKVGHAAIVCHNLFAINLLEGQPPIVPHVRMERARALLWRGMLCFVGLLEAPASSIIKLARGVSDDEFAGW